MLELNLKVQIYVRQHCSHPPYIRIAVGQLSVLLSSQRICVRRHCSHLPYIRIAAGQLSVLLSSLRMWLQAEKCQVLHNFQTVLPLLYNVCPFKAIFFSFFFLKEHAQKGYIPHINVCVFATFLINHYLSNLLSRMSLISSLHGNTLSWQRSYS